MDSQDKLVAISISIALLFMIGFYVADNAHEQTMKRIENARNQREMSLIVELEKAKAEQAKYRALEIGYLCAFKDEYGDVYESEECKG